MTHRSRYQAVATLLILMLIATTASCGGGGSGSDSASSTAAAAEEEVDSSTDESSKVDITNAIFTELSPDCADYIADYTASVLDMQRSLGFGAEVTMTADDDSCDLLSNNIPNHDFNDDSAAFATNVATVNQSFTLPRNPALGAEPTALSQRTYDGIMLNGVPLDLLSAGCYAPNHPLADVDGNVHIGCNTDDPWLLDPLGTTSKFGADQHNAHTQPNGSYHYHGNPHAMFDDHPGPYGSPVIGFAADGFPIYGSYFYDEDTGSVRMALSGYTLKPGSRPESAYDPGGSYDGTYIDDWEYTASGDLDACNGMEINGQYGYYVTDRYPWVIGCLSGVPDGSFDK
jgi:hypothetical protein